MCCMHAVGCAAAHLALANTLARHSALTAAALSHNTRAKAGKELDCWTCAREPFTCLLATSETT